ncbi:peroxisome biogenesis protein 22-like [Oryza brachyantha]|uniref:Peroxisome biogenesis protein 22 n=1 Tax=Oryza brachyantha TaxID=4533 RepID=J3M2J6_ORYBR|nr:peroxisome biogenesis protein 22-like [Oryza brachyantha]
MPGLAAAADQDPVSLVRRVSRALNRRVSDLVGLLFHHKTAGSLGAVAGFAIAVVFAWKFLRSSPARPRRPEPKRPSVGPAATDSAAADAVEPAGDPGKLSTRQIVVKRLSGCRKVTCQLLGVVFEEKTPEELQKHATVRPSVVELLLEIARYCDLYLMETVLDDKSEENALIALESAGLFKTGGLMKEKVLFSSTEIGRTSFVRQLEADFHIDTSLDIISQLSRFIRCQLFVSSIEGGQLASNVFNSPSLEQFFS